MGFKGSINFLSCNAKTFKGRSIAFISFFKVSDFPKKEKNTEPNATSPHDLFLMAAANIK